MDKKKNENNYTFFRTKALILSVMLIIISSAAGVMAYFYFPFMVSFFSALSAGLIMFVATHSFDAALEKKAFKNEEAIDSMTAICASADKLLETVLKLDNKLKFDSTHREEARQVSLAAQYLILSVENNQERLNEIKCCRPVSDLTEDACKAADKVEELAEQIAGEHSFAVNMEHMEEMKETLRIIKGLRSHTFSISADLREENILINH